VLSVRLHGDAQQKRHGSSSKPAKESASFKSKIVSAECKGFRQKQKAETSLKASHGSAQKH
jgi:hypothetical protein